MRGRRVIEIRRRKFYDNLPDEYNPNDANNTLDKSFNDDDKMNDYTYDRDLEDEIDDDDQSRSEDSDASDEETRNRFIMRKKRMRKKAIPLKSIQDKLKNTGRSYFNC